MTRRSSFRPASLLLAAGFALAWASPALANGCSSEEAVGIDLEGIRAKHAHELSTPDAAEILEKARRLDHSGTNPDPSAADESRVLALLLLHRVLDGEFPAPAKADALILASQLRDRLSSRHQPSHYRCRELKAVDEYVAAHDEGYAFAELWGQYVYRAQPFLDLYVSRLPKDEAIRARFEVYRSLDPCSMFQYDNACYGPFFSRLAEEAAGTPVHGAVMEYAFTANLNLAACPQATPEEREIGETAARRWARQLGADAAGRLAEFDTGSFEAEALSPMCRTFSDV